MRSIVARTEEIDEINEAVEELYEQVSEVELLKNTVGVAYVYFDTDFDELSRALQEKFDFPIVGVSTIALLENKGYLEYGIELLVMTDDEVFFEVGITDCIGQDDFREKTIDKIREIKSRRKDDSPKLVLSYISKSIGISGDDYLSIFDKEFDGAPVYGGMASDMFKYKDFRVFCKDRVDENGVVFVVMYGNVNPIVVAASSVSQDKLFGGVVTEAEGNTIYKIEGETFLDTLEKEGLLTENESGNVAMEYMQTPFILDVPMNDSESVEVLRNLVYLNREDGSAQFLGNIAKGSTIRVSTIRSEDIGKSINIALSSLLSVMDNSKDYKYSTIICTSCTGRYINLVGDKTIEGNAYKDIIPDYISLVGMYSFGEICPVKSQISDKFFNLFHNETFTILAL